MKKILSIDKNNKVLFEAKDGSTTVGTKEDCLAYAYNFTNGACYVCNSKKPIRNLNTDLGKSNNIYGANNISLGRFNELRRSNGLALGFANKIYATSNFGVVIGKNAYAENYGEIALSSNIMPDRSKYSILHYNGTTTSETPTELFLGGSQGQRFFINEAFESAIAIDYTACAINTSANLIWTNYGHATYKFANSTLTEVGHTKSTTIKDSHLNYDIEFAPISGTPDYIELKVEGASGHTAYWSVTLKVTEVRYA
tara:strand:- start:350 stop:1114 length:765 start_codon:yes stop_codon:yes gene_type:complete